MVGLVLQAAGEEAVPADLDWRTCPVEAAYRRKLVPRQFVVRPGDGQAALVVLGLGAAGLDARVDDMADVPLPGVVRAVIDEDREVDANLGGCQADPFGHREGDEHVVDQLREHVVEFRHGAARRVEHGVADHSD